MNKCKKRQRRAVEHRVQPLGNTPCAPSATLLCMALHQQGRSVTGGTAHRVLMRLNSGTHVWATCSSHGEEHKGGERPSPAQKTSGGTGSSVRQRQSGTTVVYCQAMSQKHCT